MLTNIERGMHSKSNDQKTKLLELKSVKCESISAQLSIEYFTIYRVVYEKSNHHPILCNQEKPKNFHLAG